MHMNFPLRYTVDIRRLHLLLHRFMALSGVSISVSRTLEKSKSIASTTPPLLRAVRASRLGLPSLH
jgi:hypothetical protein